MQHTNPLYGRPGLRIEEVSTEHHELPSNRQGQGSPIPLPPGHPLAGTQFVNAHPVVPAVTVLPAAPTIKLESETNPDFYSISLPSEFQFYSFKALSARHLKARHQSKFNRAHKEENLRYLVEAVSSLIGDGISAFDLTPADFYFLLYWLRINSFPKKPQILRTVCTNHAHAERTVLPIADPQYLDPETLKITDTVNTLLDTKYASQVDTSAYAELNAKYFLGVETMRDVCDFEDLRVEWETKEFERERAIEVGQTSAELEFLLEDIEFLGARASFLARIEGRTSMLDRIRVVAEMEVDEIDLIDQYTDAVVNYGVTETATVKCKECGASMEVDISIDALHFLP